MLNKIIIKYILLLFFILTINKVFSNEIIETYLYDNRVNDSISIKRTKTESPKLYEKTDKFRIVYQLQKLNDVKRISFIEINEDYSFAKLLNTEINLRIRDYYIDSERKFHLFGIYQDSSNIPSQKFGHAKISFSKDMDQITFQRMDYGTTNFLTLNHDNSLLLEPMLIRDSTNKRYAYLNVYDTSFVLQRQLLIRDTVVVGGVQQIQKSKDNYFYYLTLKKDGTCNICSYVYLYKLDENYKTIGKFEFGNSQNETMTLQQVTKDEKFLIKRIDQTSLAILYRPKVYFLYNNIGELIYKTDTICKQQEPFDIISEYLLENNALILVDQDKSELTYNLRYYNNKGEFQKRILLHDQKIDTTMLTSFQFTQLNGNNTYLLSCSQVDGSGDTNKVIDTGIRLFLLDFTNSVNPKVLTVSDKPIYPNPALEYINVNEFLMSRYRIFSLTGQENIQGIIYDEKLNISALKSGLYFITFNLGEKTTTYKFIKQ